MAVKIRVKIGVCLLSAALSGAAGLGSCLTEEVHSGAPDGSVERNNAAPPSGEKSAEGASRTGTHFAPRVSGDGGPIPTATPAPAAVQGVVARDANAPSANNGNPNGIDTRITVFSRRPPGGRGKPENAKVVRIAPRNLLARPFAPAAAEPIGRNSIGAFVVHREGPVEHGGPHFPTVAHSPPPGAIGTLGSATGRFAKPDALSVRSVPGANPAVRVGAVNRGTINGTSLARPGSAPSGVGGPAKTAAGLNGSAIRPRY
jgi:hypothetical protein